jgi:hypothetical protein
MYVKFTKRYKGFSENLFEFEVPDLSGGVYQDLVTSEWLTLNELEKGWVGK